MKRLIISFLSYDWIVYCSGLIMRDPENFDVIVVCRDNLRTIEGFPDLCVDATYIQRRYDVFNIGKKLGIKKISNLGHNENSVDIPKLVAELQLYITLSSIKVIYCYNNYVLRDIVSVVGKNIRTPVYIYGDIKEENLIVNEQTAEEGSKKYMLHDLLIGADKKEKDILLRNSEQFLLIGGKVNGS